MMGSTTTTPRAEGSAWMNEGSARSVQHHVLPSAQQKRWPHTSGPDMQFAIRCVHLLMLLLSANVVATIMVLASDCLRTCQTVAEISAAPGSSQAMARHCLPTASRNLMIWTVLLEERPIVKVTVNPLPLVARSQQQGSALAMFSAERR